MLWRLWEPGHQQVWYWHPKPDYSVYSISRNKTIRNEHVVKRFACLSVPWCKTGNWSTGAMGGIQLFFDVYLNKLLNKQMSCQWFDTLMWYHCNGFLFLQTEVSTSHVRYPPRDRCLQRLVVLCPAVSSSGPVCFRKQQLGSHASRNWHRRKDAYGGRFLKVHGFNRGVTLDISESPIDFQWGYQKYPG